MATTAETGRRPDEEPAEGVAVADLDVPEQSAGRVTGGAPSTDLREGDNHNEVLAVTA